MGGGGVEGEGGGREGGEVWGLSCLEGRRVCVWER